MEKEIGPGRRASSLAAFAFFGRSSSVSRQLRASTGPARSLFWCITLTRESLRCWWSGDQVATHVDAFLK